MKVSLTIILLVIILPNATSQTIESQINKLYKSQNKKSGYSIGVFQDGEIIFQKQYGLANLDYDIKIDSQTVFDIASISKQFTAAAILLLEKENKLNIKDPISKYLPEIRHYKKGIPTIENLLNQTSGIKEVDPYFPVLDKNGYDVYTESELYNIIYRIKDLNFEPATKHQYTNSNYILLARIVRNVANKSLGDFLKEAVFEPLKMHSTFVYDNRYKVVKNRAVGYLEDNGTHYQFHKYGFALGGDGQIYTTTNDMFKWEKNLNNATIGTKDIWDKMYTKTVLKNGKQINYGMGVEFENYKGYQASGHSGMWSGGFVSKYLRFPEKGLTFFTVQNDLDWDYTDKFYALVDLFIKEEKKSKQKTQKSYDYKKTSSRELKKYEGKYYYFSNTDATMIRTINKEKDTLFYKNEDEKIGYLLPIGNDKFVYKESKEDKGNIITFDVSNNKKSFKFPTYENEMDRNFIEITLDNLLDKKKYVGTYYNSDFGLTRKIEMINGNLIYYSRNNTYTNEMVLISKNIFDSNIGQFTFNENKDGKITSFQMIDVVFKRIKNCD